MQYEDEYPNLDFDYVSGSHRKLLIRNLPSEYRYFSAERNKGHIVHEDTIQSGSIAVGKGICGIETKKGLVNEKPKADGVCKDCLKKMDKWMSRYLWDEENEEFYDPIKER